MSRVCQITGKGRQNGHKVSHANNKSPLVREANVQRRRIYVPELKKFVRVRISTHGLKVLDRKGAYQTLKEAGLI